MFLFSVLATGCTSPQKPAPAKKTSLTFASSSDVITLDPQDMTDNTSEQVTRMIYNNLVKFDDKLNPVPDLAERWEANGTTWTFYLRKNVKFHDGTPFNAEAVKKNFERVLNPENNLKRRPLFNMIKSIDVVSEYVVNIVTNEPFGALPATLAHGSGAILSPTAAAKFGKAFGKSAEAAVGTGPFRPVEWKKDEILVLQRYDDYWGPKPLLEKVVYRPIPEAAARVLALETGEVDVISHIPANDLPRLESNDKVTVHKVVSNGQRQFRFHCKKKPFDNPKVRQAVSYAIDRKAIVDSLLKGTAVPSTGALAPVTWGYVDLGTIPHDPEKAKRLLAEAGYPKGFKTRIATTERYVQGVEVAQAIAAQLKEVGIDASIDVMEWSAIVQLWSGLKPEDNPLEIFIMGAGPSTGDADWGLRPIFRSAPTNENNYGYYSNAEFDELIDRAMKTTDPETRKQLYRRAQEIVYLEDPGAVWVYDTLWIVASQKNVKDISMSPLALVTFEKAHFE